MKHWKSSNGSITLLVVITVLFFVIIAVGVYVANSNTRVSQMQEIDRIKEVYEADVKEMDTIYESIVDEEAIEMDGYVTDSLYAYYDGISNTGTTHNSQVNIWTDKSGNNRNITLTGFDGTSTSGWTSNGLAFDGINDWLDTGTAQANLGNEFTFSTRIYNKASNNYRGLWGSHVGRSDGGIDGTTAQWTDGPLLVGYGKNIVKIPAEKVNNTWITLTVTMNVAQGTKVYINGELILQSNIAENFVPLGNLMIGKSLDSQERYFMGEMKNFLIYTRALTDQEVEQIYKIDGSRYME